jgi:signal transduction histidine kinase/CheY-like chemotaxis protein
LHPIPWYRRLETRVAGGISLLVALSLAAVILATTLAVKKRALDSATESLASAQTVFYHLAADRQAFASAQAGLVTALPVFRSHMSDARLAADLAQLQVLGEEYRGLMKADFCIVADRDGRWTARPGWTGSGEPPDALRQSISTATAGRGGRAVVGLGARLFLVVSEPARFGDEVLGTLTAGFALDDALARRLAQETGWEVNLVTGGRLAASSLAGVDRESLAALVAAGDPRFRSGAKAAVQPIGAGTYTVGVSPLSPEPSQRDAGSLILLQDWTATAAFVARSQWLIGSIGLAVFATAVGVGWVFAQRTVQPLNELVAAAGDIADGNWSRRATPKGGAETTMLAKAFNDMTTSLRHWYEEARQRDDQFRQAQKMEAIGRLAGGVAHDFNNLLTAIKGYGELISDDLRPDDPHREDLGEIVKAADRASELTRQLLAFSRRQVVMPRVIAINETIAGTYQLLRRLIGEDIELMSALAPGTSPVRGDPGQIEQLLVNLAVNARDAMPTGGRLRIELSNVVFGARAGIEHPKLSPGPYIQLTVSDTGCGMDEATASRIFEPFFTTKGPGRGTGLGLAMVYGVVEQLGGAIDVETAVGRGTTFRLYFPEASGEVPDESVGPAHAMPASLRGSETILLVEDDPHVRTLIERSLVRLGYEVLSAANGQDALELVRLRSDATDLLLTDVVMPGMNGRELAQKVMAEGGTSRVMFMSGYSDDAVLQHGIETTTVCFIQKPFAMDDLALRIRETLTPA